MLLKSSLKSIVQFVLDYSCHNKYFSFNLINSSNNMLDYLQSDSTLSTCSYYPIAVLYVVQCLFLLLSKEIKNNFITNFLSEKFPDDITVIQKHRSPNLLLPKPSPNLNAPHPRSIGIPRSTGLR